MTTEFTFDHVHLYVRDLPAAADFYERVFGMRRLREFELRGLRSIRMDAGGARVTLTEQPRDVQDGYHPVDHFALNTPDFDQAIELLRARGAQFRAEPTRVGEYQVAFIDAPEGVVVEVMSPASS